MDGHHLLNHSPPPYFLYFSCVVYILEKAMAPHSSHLAWKIPWLEEPGRLQSMGSLRVGHNWATSLSLFTFMHWRRKWQPTPVFFPGESQGQGGTWWVVVYGVAQSWTRLKRLSSSSSSSSIYLAPGTWGNKALICYKISEPITLNWPSSLIYQYLSANSSSKNTCN